MASQHVSSPVSRTRLRKHRINIILFTAILSPFSLITIVSAFENNIGSYGFTSTRRKSFPPLNKRKSLDDDEIYMNNVIHKKQTTTLCYYEIIYYLHLSRQTSQPKGTRASRLREWCLESTVVVVEERGNESFSGIIMKIQFCVFALWKQYALACVVCFESASSRGKLVFRSLIICLMKTQKAVRTGVDPFSEDKLIFSFYTLD